MNKIVLIFTCLLYSFITVYGQNNSGSIKGIIITNAIPVEFANVYLTLKTDSTKIITGTTTDSLGNFMIDKIFYGDYILYIRSLGFIPNKTNITLDAANSKIDLKTIEIKTDELLLKSVDITSFRKSIKRTEQGFVVDASDNLTQSGGTAEDLLKNMPTVMIDADGVITVRGKTPLILINGRTSGLTGINRTAQLDRIPASNIERIEINNNPSAKYDADAEAGIINIILKTNEEFGTNGAFSLGLGYGAKERLNGSLMLNHKNEKWNLGLYYNNWYTVRTRSVNGDRVNYFIPENYYLTQRRNDNRIVKNQELKLNTEYTPNKKNTLNFNAAWLYNEQDNNETLTSTFETNTHSFTRRNIRHSVEIRKFNTFELELIYVKTFDKKGQLLSASITSSFNDDKENTDIDVKNLSQDNVQIGDLNLERTKNYELENMTTTAIDYKQPISNIGIIETGYKNIFRYLDADFQTYDCISGNYVINPLRSNIFKYTEQIHALYVQFNGSIGDSIKTKWKYDAGIRAEQVFNYAKITDNINSFSNQYFNLFPSANLVFYPKPADFLKLSYSRRINRPDLDDLNPFIDITDSLNQHGGNPDLKPELIHSFELSYNHDWKKASLSFATFFRQTNNVIMTYLSSDTNGVFLMKPNNFGSAINYGAEGVLTVNTDKFWSANLSYSLYQTEISGVAYQKEITTNVLCWYTKLINNFTLWKGSKLQISVNYTSPVAIPQGEKLEVYYMDIGFQQKFRNDRGRLGIVFTDVFNTQQSGSVTSDESFYFYSKRRIDSRAVLVTFAYTFGTSVNDKLMENKFKNE